MKTALLFIVLSFAFSLHAQEILIDKRDGTQYDIVQIGEHLWFQENLRFKTPTSFCSENPTSTACSSGNYYYPTDLINVCPEGWGVPTWNEFKKAIKEIERHYNLQVEYSGQKLPLYRDLDLEAEQILGLTLIDDTTFLDLTATGWIEGDKWEPAKNTSIWIVHDISNTPQPHLHITANQITMHSHGHNVLDKPKKLRRFTVRCVKRVEKDK